MKKKYILILVALMVVSINLMACSSSEKKETDNDVDTNFVKDEFIKGVDVSSLLSLEASGTVFYDFEGEVCDPLKTMSESGINYLRVRVWNDPFDADGNGYFASVLVEQEIDFDIFATSYYPLYHGTIENLVSELEKVIEKTGKKVMVAETSWAYTGYENEKNLKYPVSVQGQKQAISEVIEAVKSFDDNGVGVFYWEPAWIKVPGDTWEEQSYKWEKYGSGWASSYAGSYDPYDAGLYYGGSACENTSLFDSEGKPLESLRAFK